MPMFNTKSLCLVPKVSRLIITTLALLGMAGTKIVSASEITTERIKVAAKTALSKMKPVQIRIQGDAIPFVISADKKETLIEDDFRVELGSQPPLLDNTSQALYLANGIAGIESSIVESLRYIEARLSLESALRPQPTIDSFRRSLTKGEFETQRQFEDRVSQEHAKALKVWNAREQDVASVLAKHAGSWRVLIPGLNREVETIPVVFHAVPEPQLFEPLAQRLFGTEARIDSWHLPRFDPETLKYRNASFCADLWPKGLGNLDLKLDMIGSESLEITAKNVAQAQKLKQACEEGSALMSAQALPILARVLGGKSRGYTSYKFLVLLFDIRFLDGANDGQPYEGISVTLGEAKLDATDKGYSFPTGYSKKDRDAFYLKLSELLGKGTLHK